MNDIQIAFGKASTWMNVLRCSIERNNEAEIKQAILRVTGELLVIVQCLEVRDAG